MHSYITGPFQEWIELKLYDLLNAAENRTSAQQNNAQKTDTERGRQNKDRTINEQKESILPSVRVRTEILLKPLDIDLIASYPKIRGNSHIVCRHLLNEASNLGHGLQVFAVPVPIPANFENRGQEAVDSGMGIDFQFLILSPIIEGKECREHSEPALIYIVIVFLQICHHLFADLLAVLLVPP